MSADSRPRYGVTPRPDWLKVRVPAGGSEAEIARLVTEHAGRQKTAKAEGKTASRSRTCAGCDGPAHKCDECGRAWAKYPARDLSGIAGCVCGICIRDDGSLSFA